MTEIKENKNIWRIFHSFLGWPAELGEVQMERQSLGSELQ